MKVIIHSIITTLAICLLSCYSPQDTIYQIDESRLLSYIVNPKQQNLQFYWKDDQGENYTNFESLKEDLESQNKDLIFAMNGGMYLKDLSPQGLYIENGIEYANLDTLPEGYGNFYLQPNGVFYLTKEQNAVVCTSQEFQSNPNIHYATQSGPMLLIDGEIHPKFRKGSENLHIRNGVGILPDGNILFAMSKEKINFYDFATFFKQNNCKNALYLDGFVSRTYLPTKGYNDIQGRFGVIIAEIN